MKLVRMDHGVPWRTPGKGKERPRGRRRRKRMVAVWWCSLWLSQVLSLIFIPKFYFLINDKRNLSTTGHGCRQLASSIHILECNNRKAASVFSSFKTCLASGDTALRCIDLRPTGGFD